MWNFQSNYIFVPFFFLITFACFYFGRKIYRGTKNKSSKWGLNVNPPCKWFSGPAEVLPSVCCPACGENVRKVRMPRSVNQLLWGGWKCHRCHSELDKWGRLVRHHTDRNSEEPDPKDPAA